MKLSLILPIYNDRSILEMNFERIYKTMKHDFRRQFEIVLAEDGSDDGSEEIVKKLSKLKLVRVTSAANRRGRGGAIKDAIKISRGQVVGYVDIDLATPLRYIKKAGESCRKWQQNSNRF